MAEPQGPAERLASLELDAAVDDAFAGRPADPLVERLVRAHATEPPPRLARAVGRAIRRRWLPVRAAAALLAATFLVQGIGNLTNARWLARNLDLEFDYHLFLEGGVVLLALGGVVLAGALARRRLDLAVAAGAPVGIVLGINGAGELGEFPAGGVLHTTQGVAALALLALWLHARRYEIPPRAKRKR